MSSATARGEIRAVRPHGWSAEFADDGCFCETCCAPREGVACIILPFALFEEGFWRNFVHSFLQGSHIILSQIKLEIKFILNLSASYIA